MPTKVMKKRGFPPDETPIECSSSIDLVELEKIASKIDRSISSLEQLGESVKCLNSSWTVVSREFPELKFVDFNVLVHLKKIPYYNTDITCPLKEINRENSFIVFISHNYFNYDQRSNTSFPDNETRDKWKLCVDGIKKLRKKLAPKMKHCYIFMDYCCLDTTAPNLNEELNLLLIMRCCDIVFTPIVDNSNVAPRFGSTYEEYQAEQWNGTPRAYLNRGWCRFEMQAGYYLHLLDCASSHRLSKFKGKLREKLESGKRPHYVYSTNEMNNNCMPFILEADEQFFRAYNPLSGNFDCNIDKHIVGELVKRLKYIQHNVRFNDEAEVPTATMADIKQPDDDKNYSDYPTIITFGLMGSGKTSLAWAMLNIHNSKEPTLECNAYFCESLKCYILDVPGFDLIREHNNSQVINLIIRKILKGKFRIGAIIVLDMYSSPRGKLLHIPFQMHNFTIPGWVNYFKTRLINSQNVFCVVADVSGYPESPKSTDSNSDITYINLRFNNDEYNDADVAKLKEILQREMLGNETPVVRENAVPANNQEENLCYLKISAPVTVFTNKCLGKGNFGYVYEGLYGNESVAVKSFKDYWETDRESVKNEVEMHEKLINIPGVVRFLGTYFEGNEPRCVFELAHGALFDALYRNKPMIDLSLNSKLNYLWQIAMALQAVGELKIIHRDIKPANVLIFLQVGKLVMKLCDLGIACNPGFVQKILGTPAYMAPELLMEGSPITSAVDVYAYGVLANELLSQKQPFADIKDEKELRHKVIVENTRPKLFVDEPESSIDKELVSLIKPCWNTSRYHRPSFKEIIDKLEALKKNVYQYRPRVDSATNAVVAAETKLMEVISNVATMDTDSTADLNAIMPAVRDVLLNDPILVRTMSTLQKEFRSQQLDEG